MLKKNTRKGVDGLMATIRAASTISLDAYTRVPILLLVSVYLLVCCPLKRGKRDQCNGGHSPLIVNKRRYEIHIFAFRDDVQYADLPEAFSSGGILQYPLTGRD